MGPLARAQAEAWRRRERSEDHKALLAGVLAELESPP
jgi:hypothetical protein